MRILIAEDDTASRMIVEAMLEQLGHEVVSTTNGQEAWEVFQKTDMDVVISDCSMPMMDGLELCRRVRSRPNDDKYTYFIFVTSFGDKHLILDANDAGADDYLVKPLNTDQLAARLVVAERISHLHERLAAQRSQLELLNLRLFDQARTDPLTRLHNRLKLREDLDELAARATGHFGPYCALMFDVDHFKAYNDTYGHFAGDKVLTNVARVLLRNCRQADHGYRFGGEEFLLILEGTSLQEACLVAELCRNAIQALRIPHDAGVGKMVTISAGVAQWRQGTETVNTWLREADSALYRAKSLGRNQVYPEVAEEIAPCSPENREGQPAVGYTD
ncbi:GGDEF domain-containing response regulator [Acidocella sp.]|jgi:diguanylate cyclase (GGDEF)-like protein|uniref:GGDEF domain-containing response regulator n=1 Tax=Acidocella sp. TaxID=50710 RepID=UPI002F3F7EC7